MKRVLFVDDEPGILEGLQRLLRPQRKQWEMHFVSSATAALEALARERFDVLVSDMKMPGMDGAALLARVVELHPEVVRIVMTGHADLEASMRSVTVSHQFLTKPCEPELLRRVVERACELGCLLQDEALQAVVGDVGELPLLPRTYQKLVSALADPEVDLGAVGAIVEQDPAIAAKILQLVNSSYFAVRKEISDVRQATVRLGVHTIRDLVLTFEVFREFDASSALPGFSIEHEQLHALRTARLARRLLEDRKQAEQAFLAGLLHDLGSLVLVTRLRERYGEVRRVAKQGTRPLHEVEQELLGVTHAEIGAYLLGLWGMPYPVLEAVANHHHPARVADQHGLGVLAAVHAAESLSHESSGLERAALDESYLSSLGLLERLPAWSALAEEERQSRPDAA